MMTQERIDAGIAYYRRVTGDEKPVTVKVVDTPVAEADPESLAYINAITGEIHLISGKSDAESLMHELVHLWQIRRGSLRYVPVGINRTRSFFDGEDVSNLGYWGQPHEYEARVVSMEWAAQVDWPVVLRLKTPSCYDDTSVEEVPAFNSPCDFKYANA